MSDGRGRPQTRVAGRGHHLGRGYNHDALMDAAGRTDRAHPPYRSERLGHTGD
jgi:hypothetical protein